MTTPELNDEQLDQLLATARQSWRVDNVPDHDALWSRIEHETFDKPAEQIGRGAPSWRTLTWVAAAALAVGAGIGRYSAPTAPATVIAESTVPDDQSDRRDNPLLLTTAEYLGETSALLASLERDADDGAVSARFASDASSLLSTTRLLIDAPAAADPELRALLSDLELVLAQIARLPARRDNEELEFINEAILARDVVPRLRLAAIDYAPQGN
jgi:hypothetical protein